MHEELAKRLRELASIPEHCENFDNCDECSKEDICLSFTNDRIIEVATEAANVIEELSGFVQEAERDRDEYRERLDKANDAIEELMKAAKAMHTWIFLNTGDEQAAYDECGLTNEMNAALGYSGQFVIEPPKEGT